MNLTVRQSRFVDEYTLCNIGSEAAVRAGYAESGARQEAYRLLTKADIRAAIAAKQAETAAHLEITKRHVLIGLLQAIEVAKAKQDPRSQIAGWKEIGKLLGFYAPDTVRTTLTRQGEEMLMELRTLPEHTLLKLARGGDAD